MVASDASSLLDTPAISSTAASNASSFAFDGFVKPLIFRTNCTEAARTSSGVTGGSKLKSGLIFRHIDFSSLYVGQDGILRPDGIRPVPVFISF